MVFENCNSNKDTIVKRLIGVPKAIFCLPGSARPVSEMQG